MLLRRTILVSKQFTRKKFLAEAQKNPKLKDFAQSSMAKYQKDHNQQLLDTVHGAEFRSFTTLLDEQIQSGDSLDPPQEQLVISKLAPKEVFQSIPDSSSKHYLPNLGNEAVKVRREMTQKIDDAFLSNQILFDKEPQTVSDAALEANELKYLELDRSKQVIFKKKLFDDIIQKERRNVFNHVWSPGEEEGLASDAPSRLDIGQFPLKDRSLASYQDFSDEMLQVLHDDFEDIKSDFTGVKKLFAQTQTYQSKDPRAKHAFHEFETKLAGLKNYKIRQVVESSGSNDDFLEKYLDMLEQDSRLDSQKILSSGKAAGDEAGSSHALVHSKNKVETGLVEVNGDAEEDSTPYVTEVDSLLDVSEKLKSNLAYQTTSMRSNALLFANPYDFAQLSLMEKKNYIKTRIKNHYDLLNLISDQMNANALDFETVLAAYQKLALIVMDKHNLYDNPEFADISIIRNVHYRPLLTMCLAKLKKMSLDQFARFVYCFGVIHQRDQGQAVESDLGARVMKSISDMLAIKSGLVSDLPPRLAKKHKKLISSNEGLSAEDVHHFGVVLKSVAMLGQADYHFFRSKQMVSFFVHFFPAHIEQIARDAALVDKFLGFCTLTFQYNQDNSDIKPIFSRFVSELVSINNFGATKPFNLDSILNALMTISPTLLPRDSVTHYFKRLANDIHEGVLSVNMGINTLTLLNSALSMQRCLPEMAFNVSRHFLLQKFAHERYESQALVVSAHVTVGFELQRVNRGLLGGDCPPKPAEQFLLNALFGFQSKKFQGKNKLVKYHQLLQKMLQICEEMGTDELLNLLQMLVLFRSDRVTFDLVHKAIWAQIDKFDIEELVLLHLVNCCRPESLFSREVQLRMYSKCFSVSFDDQGNSGQDDMSQFKQALIECEKLSISELFHLVFAHYLQMINRQPHIASPTQE